MDVEKIEKIFIEKELLLDAVVDTFIINLTNAVMTVIIHTYYL